MGGNYFHMDGIIFLISLFFASRFLAEEDARVAQVGGQAMGKQGAPTRDGPWDVHIPFSSQLGQMLQLLGVI